MKRFPVPSIAQMGCVLVLGLLVGACSDGNSSGADQSTGSMAEAMDGGMMHDHAESTPVAEGARRIEVGATSFAFDPDRITVDIGEDVAIVLSSDDLLHDFTVDAIDVHVAADRGQTVEGGLRGETPGEYAFYCTVPGHREAGMEGTLVVKAP